MSNKQVNELTTISGANYSDYLVLYDSNEAGDEKLKKMDVWDFVDPAMLDLYVSQSSGDDNNDGSPGSPLETIEEALIRMTNSLNGGGSITLEEGTYTLPAWGVNMSSKSLSNLFIVGEADELEGDSGNVGVLSIQSSSGSAGDWDYILNLDDVSNIDVGNYINLYRSGGISNCERLEGCWEVINVDGGNDRITVTVTDPSSSALSGSLEADVAILKTVLTGEENDVLFTVGGGCSIFMGDLCLVPNGMFSKAMEIRNGGYVSIMNDYGFGISGGSSAVECDNGGKFETLAWNDKPVAISSYVEYGIYLNNNSNATISLYSRENNFVISGNNDDSGAAFFVTNNSSAYLDAGIIVAGVEGDGIIVDYCSSFKGSGSNVWCREVGGDAFTCENNSMIDCDCSVLNCGGTGWVAHFGGRIHHYDATNADGSSTTNDGYLYGVV